MHILNSEDRISGIRFFMLFPLLVMLAGCEPLLKPGYFPEGYTYNKNTDDYEAHRGTLFGGLFAKAGDTLQGTPERAEAYERKKEEQKRLQKAEEAFPELSDDTAWAQFSGTAPVLTEKDKAVEIYDLSGPYVSTRASNPAYGTEDPAVTDPLSWQNAADKLIGGLEYSFGTPSSKTYLDPRTTSGRFETAIRDAMKQKGWAIAQTPGDGLFTLQLDQQDSGAQTRLSAALMSGPVLVAEESVFLSQQGGNRRMPDTLSSYGAATYPMRKPTALTP